MVIDPVGPVAGDHAARGPGPDRPGPDRDDRPEAERRLPLVLGIGAAVLVLDQLTKAWAVAGLADGPVHVVGTLRLALTHNTAAAFGLGGGLVPLLAVAALGVVVYLIVSGTAASRLPVAIAMGLLLGGAIGNLADRVFRAPGLLRGAVIDFLDLQWWPVFNVADMGITCGCVMLLLFAGRSPSSAATATTADVDARPSGPSSASGSGSGA